MKLPHLLLLGLLAPSIAGAGAGANASVPVMVGSHAHADLDACPSYGELASDSLIRNAPTQDASFVAPIAKGVRVFVCGPSPDGRWDGVVVAIAGKDCGVSEPVAAPAPYDGPCASGWIPRNVVTVLGG